MRGECWQVVVEGEGVVEGVVKVVDEGVVAVEFEFVGGIEYEGGVGAEVVVGVVVKKNKRIENKE